MDGNIDFGARWGNPRIKDYNSQATPGYLSGLKMERGSNRIGSRGEEGKERLQESCEEEEEEESPLQSER